MVKSGLSRRTSEEACPRMVGKGLHREKQGGRSRTGPRWHWTFLVTRERVVFQIDERSTQRAETGTESSVVKELVRHREHRGHRESCIDDSRRRERPSSTPWAAVGSGYRSNFHSEGTLVDGHLDDIPRPDPHRVYRRLCALCVLCGYQRAFRSSAIRLGPGGLASAMPPCRSVVRRFAIAGDGIEPS